MGVKIKPFLPLAFASYLLVPALRAEEEVRAVNTPSVQMPLSIEKKSPSLINNVYASTTLASKYLGTFGFTLSDGAVQQSDIGFSIGKLDYNLWTNFDLQTKKVNEIDNSLSTTLETKYLNLTPGFVWFTFPTTTFADAYSFSLTASTKNLPVNISLYGVQSLDEHGDDMGRLAQLTVSKYWNLDNNKKWNLGLEGRATYANQYFSEGSGFSTSQGKASLTYNIDDKTSLSVSARTQRAFESMQGTFKDTKIVGALTFSRKF